MHIGFSSFGGLFHSFLNAFDGALAGSDGAFHHGNSSFRASRCVFHSRVNQVGDGLLCFSSFFFHGLGEFAASAGSDFIHVAAERNSFFAQGLHVASLQGHQFLNVFDAHQGVDVVLVVRQSSFGSGHVEFNHFFNASESFVAQAEKGVNAGFVSGNHLFWGHHGVFL